MSLIDKNKKGATPPPKKIVYKSFTYTFFSSYLSFLLAPDASWFPNTYLSTHIFKFNVIEYEIENKNHPQTGLF